MNILSRAATWVYSQVRNFVTSAIPVTDAAIASIFGLSNYLTSNRLVTHDHAMKEPSYFSATDLISSAIAVLEFEIHDKDKARLTLATEHPLYRLLAYRPNPYWNSFTFFKQVTQDVLNGNAFVYVVREGNTVVSMWRLEPNFVRVKYNEGKIKSYEYREEFVKDGIPQAAVKQFDDREIIHIPLHDYDGCFGKGKFHFAKETIGMSLDVVKYGSTFFGGGGIPNIVITTPNTLDDTAKANIQESFQSSKSKGGGRGVVVLDEGMLPHNIASTPEDGQFLQTRNYQSKEIARVFRVPPFMLYDYDGQRSANFEDELNNFLSFTLQPYMRLIILEFTDKLLSTDEQRRYELRFNTKNLIRLNTTQQWQKFREGRNLGVYTLNNILRELDMPIIDGEYGDQRIAPSTMKVLGEADPSTPVATSVVEEFYLIVQNYATNADRKTIVELAKMMMPTINDKQLNAIVDSAIESAEAIASKPQRVTKPSGRGTNGASDSNFPGGAGNKKPRELGDDLRHSGPV